MGGSSLPSGIRCIELSLWLSRRFSFFELFGPDHLGQALKIVGVFRVQAAPVRNVSVGGVGGIHLKYQAAYIPLGNARKHRYLHFVLVGFVVID